MEHFSMEQWIDFANHVGAKGLRSEMQKHLDTGCKRCEKMATLWNKVQRTAAHEARFQPPEELVREAEAAFAGTGFIPQRKISEVIAELVFDSLQQPLIAGARAGSSASRQMVFRADPFQLDVQIETRPGQPRLLVTGQILHVGSGPTLSAGIPISMSNRRGQTVHTVTNQFGEFYGEVENRGDLHLSFSGPDQKTIVVSMADVLNDLPNGGLRGD